jgi:hypothetical protein
MLTETRTADAKGRITLPKAFAGATVILELLSDNELRIRKARVIPESDLSYPVETVIRLSAAERDRFLAILENPPAPNAALRRAIAGYRKRHG